MRTLDLAGLRVHLAGGTDRNGGGNGPLLVLLHGYGAPGTDLVGLWRQLRVPADVRFAFPEGVQGLDTDSISEGRAWWPIDIMRFQSVALSGQYESLIEAVPDGLLDARARISELLDALTHTLAVPEGGIVLGGFSQGAMLATDVVLNDPRAFAGLVVLSGALTAHALWSRVVARRAGLPVLQSHGRSDPILPFAVAERLRDFLKDGGLDVEWHAFSGGHGIPDGVLTRLGAFSEQALQKAQVKRS